MMPQPDPQPKSMVRSELVPHVIDCAYWDSFEYSHDTSKAYYLEVVRTETLLLPRGVEVKPVKHPWPGWGDMLGIFLDGKLIGQLNKNFRGCGEKQTWGAQCINGHWRPDEWRGNAYCTSRDSAAEMVHDFVDWYRRVGHSLPVEPAP